MLVWLFGFGVFKLFFIFITILIFKRIYLFYPANINASFNNLDITFY